MTQLTLPMRAALVAAFVLASTGASSPILAADAPPKQAATKPSKGKANLMTRDELRACMDERDRMQDVRQQVQRENTALDAQQADIKKADADIAQKRAGLDPADAAAQQALAADVARRDEQVNAFNSQLRSLNEQTRSLDERRTAWLAKCDGRNFDELDEAAIMRERKRAAGSAK
jgi:chromosome segregation ATPase